MFWHLLKIVVFLGVAVALAFAASYVIHTPGEVRIAFGDREFFVSPIGFVIALLLLMLVAWLVLKVIGLMAAFLRLLMGDETAISRFFSRNRERRGFDALSDGMVALASGDSKAAMKQAAKAEKLLQRPDVTRLVSAQAAEMSGDRARAQAYYKEMLANDRTRPIALQKFMDHKVDEGDADTALVLGKKAMALRPDNQHVLRTVFDLQSKKADWAGARTTLNAAVHARLLPRDVGTRRDAVLSLADARAALAAGDSDRGSEAALQANRLAPTLVPAAALAAKVQADKGAKRKASKLLISVWAANPHPDLAAAFAALEPDETPHQRRQRFNTLIAANPSHPESHLLDAEVALADEDFPAARKALGDLAETQPTTRSLAIMAAIERGQGAPEAVVRGWLAKALNASRGPQWICGKCNHAHAAWVPVCENCGAFDTLDWKAAPHAEDASLAHSAMLPLIIGAEAGPAAASEPEPRMPPRPDIEDAELASGAPAARR